MTVQPAWPSWDGASAENLDGAAGEGQGGGFQEDWEGGERRSKRGRPLRRGKKNPAAHRKSCRGEAMSEGLVLSRTRGAYQVFTGAGQVSCSIRGRLRDRQEPVAGDRVRFQRAGAGGVLEQILPRRNQLVRISEEDAAMQIIAANLDRLIIMLSAHPLPPRWALADRLLALAEKEGFEPALVINKMDLVPEGSPEGQQLEEDVEVYRRLNLPVFLTSALQRAGLEELRSILKDKTSVVSGHSGVGKSTLLNALHPEFGLVVGEVNELTGKGRHTTTAARLLPIPEGGWIADTPGFREFGLGDMEPADLGRCFQEFRPWIGQCRFTDCLHLQEPNCALKLAVEHGHVHKLRYKNYLQILKGLVEGARRSPSRPA